MNVNFFFLKIHASCLICLFIFKALKKVRATGIGVHTADEIIKMGQDDLQVLIDTLGDKPYFFGDEPTIVSAYCLQCPCSMCR